MGSGKSKTPQALSSATIAAGQGAVQCVCYDGRGRVASGGADGTVKVWEDGAVVLCLRGHEGPVLCARFGGTLLCTGGRDGTARLWDAASGARVAVCDGDDGHSNAVTACDASDGTVATASMDGTAILWDGAGAQRAVIRGHAGPLHACRLSRDGRRLLTGGTDGAGVSDPATGAFVRTLRGRTTYVKEGHTKPVTAVCFDDGGGRAVTASSDGTARVWDVESGELAATLPHGAPVAACDWRGGRILTGGADGPPKVWDAATGDLVLALAGPERSTLCVALAPDGGGAAAGGAEGTVFFWALPAA